MASIGRYGKGAITLHGKGSRPSWFTLMGFKKQAVPNSPQPIYSLKKRRAPNGRDVKKNTLFDVLDRKHPD